MVDCGQKKLREPKSSIDSYWTDDFTKDEGISANPGNVIPAVMKRTEKDAENPRVSQENPTIVRNVFARHNYHMTNARSGLPFSYTEKGPFTLRQRDKANVVESNTIQITGSVQ